MQDLKALLENLWDYEKHLASFPLQERSSRFENLLARGMSLALRLPFQTVDDTDATLKHRVIWNGSEKSWTRAHGTPDAVAYAHDYCMVIEATLKTGTRQWTEELSRSIEHYEKFVDSEALAHQNCYLVLLVTELNKHTFTMVKQKVKERCCYVLLLLDSFVMILETYALAATARHADLRLLLAKIMDCCGESGGVGDFCGRSYAETGRWQKERLENERSLFIGAKSYKALRYIGRAASPGEILGQLNGDSSVLQFFSALGSQLGYDDIVDSLEHESLAYKAENIPSGEGIYYAVPLLDVKSRIKTFIREIGNVNASH